MIKKVKHLGVFACNIAVREVGAVMLSDVAIACAWEAGEFADFVCPIFGDVADAVAIVGEYLDGIRVIFIGWLRLQGGSEFTKVFFHVLAMGDACNIELDVVYTLKARFVWPDANVVAFVLDTEVAEFLDGCIFATVRTYDYTDVRIFGWPNVVI